MFKSSGGQAERAERGHLFLKLLFLLLVAALILGVPVGESVRGGWGAVVETYETLVPDSIKSAITDSRRELERLLR